MAEAVAAVDYLHHVRPKVTVSVHEKLLSAAGCPFLTHSSSSSKREEHDAAGMNEVAARQAAPGGSRSSATARLAPAALRSTA
jgi:hypothetical protein